MKHLGEKEVNRMKDLGEKGIRNANAIFMLGVFLPFSGVMHYVFLAFWIVSTILLIKSTRSITMRIIYSVILVIPIFILFLPVIYTLFLQPKL